MERNEYLVHFVVKEGQTERHDSRIVSPPPLSSGTVLLQLEENIAKSEHKQVRILGYEKLERQMTAREMMALINDIQSRIPDIDTNKLLEALQSWVSRV